MKVVLSRGILGTWEYELEPSEEKYVNDYLKDPKRCQKYSWEEYVHILLRSVLDRAPFDRLPKSVSLIGFRISDSPYKWLEAERFWPGLSEFLKNYLECRGKIPVRL